LTVTIHSLSGPECSDRSLQARCSLFRRWILLHLVKELSPSKPTEVVFSSGQHIIAQPSGMSSPFFSLQPRPATPRARTPASCIYAGVPIASGADPPSPGGRAHGEPSWRNWTVWTDRGQRSLT